MSPCWKGGQKSGWLSLKSRKTMGRFNVQASPSHGGAWLQVYPSSGWQVAEQPSPSMPLPSSHTSGAMMRPSPQLDVQPCSVQVGSPWQAALQPSNGSVLPATSQVSAPS